MHKHAIKLVLVISVACIAISVLFFNATPSISSSTSPVPTDSLDQLRYGSAASLEIDSTALFEGINQIVQEALDSNAFPGCQILLVKSGQIFYEQSFGFHTYAGRRKVKNSDIYDLASITKVTAATLALMKMYEEEKFNPDYTLGYYFPYFKKTDKANLTMREILAHQSRLKPWIPYYKEAKKKNGKYKSKTVRYDSSKKYPYRLSDSTLYLYKNFEKKKIYKWIKDSELSTEKKYVYSGLSFYLYPDLIERMSNMPFDSYLEKTFYQPLGATTLGFTPLNRFSREVIIPTEVDHFFRMDTLHGIVHDEGAAMMQGISGNAGLFSNAKDLAKVFQMLLNDGTYAGKQYLKPTTIQEFTACQYCDEGNRRGMGFDKPLIEYDSIRSSVAKRASPSSFGHTGYTGTLVWADPKEELLFVFLSNRVHPTRNNPTIYQLNIRPRIHNLVYDLLPEVPSDSIPYGH